MLDNSYDIRCTDWYYVDKKNIEIPRVYNQYNCVAGGLKYIHSCNQYKVILLYSSTLDNSYGYDFYMDEVIFNLNNFYDISRKIIDKYDISHCDKQHTDNNYMVACNEEFIRMYEKLKNKINRK